jgi:hypothetical protein
MKKQATRTTGPRCSPTRHHANPNVPANQRQNKTSKMMIGNGTPISHSNAPFPIPITTLLSHSLEQRATSAKVPNHRPIRMAKQI